jgi:hypothetical protein
VRVLVIYESMFGNTRDVAHAIAAGLGTRVAVDVMEVGEAPAVLPSDVAMLVIGAPTHAHGMTTPSSRQDAARRAGDRLVSRGIGVREWLGGLQPPVTPIPAAVFDTRIKGPGLLWGSAAKSAEKLLAGAGLRLLDAPRSFLVGGPTGEPFDRLEDGELDRARAWGVELSSSAPAAAVPAG